MGKRILSAYRGTFGKGDLIDSATVTPTTTTFTELGRYTVTAGQAIALGYGNKAGQHDAEGRIYVALVDATGTPVNLDGVVRLSAHNPQDRPRKVLAEFRTETLRTTATDPTKQIPFPAINYVLDEDWSLVLEFKGDAATAVEKADSVVLISYTNFDTSPN